MFTFREIIFSVIVVLDEENGDGPEEEAGDEGDAVKDSLHVTLDQTEQAVALRHLADQFFALGNLDIEKLVIIMNDIKIKTNLTTLKRTITKLTTLKSRFYLPNGCNVRM